MAPANIPDRQNSYKDTHGPSGCDYNPSGAFSFGIFQQHISHYAIPKKD
jgi:hypothetical protein